MTLLDYLHGSQNPIATPGAPDVTDAPDAQPEVAASIDTAETKTEAVEPTPAVEVAEASTTDAPVAPAVLAADTTTEPAVEVSCTRPRGREP